MTSKRITPLLLAASVFLTGATGAFLGAMTPAHALTSVDELSDVNRNHWAFEALRDLVEKYDVIEGYPNHTFRGDRAPTRWEMAAALNALIKTVGKDLARLGAEKANKTDLAAVARLQEEFRQELKALTERTSALEARAAAIEAKNLEQDNRLTLLEKTQIHGDMTFGGMADMSSSGTRNPDSGYRHGIRDSLSMVGRLRLSVNVPVLEDRDDSVLGEGTVYSRLIAAFGRNAPAGVQQGNMGAFSPFNGYSRIAGDSSAFNEGFGTSSSALGNGLVGGGNTRPNLYMETAYYKQHIKSGVPLLTDFMVFPDEEDWKASGDFYAGIIPWRFLFDKSPFRGNELTQFQNTAFVNTPGLAVNYNMPMVAYQWHQGLGKSLGLDLTTGMGSIDVGDVYDGLNLTYEARFNYLTSFLGPEFTKPGSFYAGGYNIWSAGNRKLFNDGMNAGVAFGLDDGALNRTGDTLTNSLRRRQATNAFYTGWNQEWYKGIGTHVSYMLSNNSRTNVAYSSLNQIYGANQAFGIDNIGVSVRQAFSAVLNVPVAALLPGFRDKDAFGVGYAFVDLQNNGVGNRSDVMATPTAIRNTNGNPPLLFGNNRLRDRFEHAAEMYYRFQLNDSISVIPSYQLIWNRLGLAQNGVTSIIGLRTSFSF